MSYRESEPRKTAGGDLGDTDDDPAVVVYLEFRTELGIFEFGEFRVLDHYKGVFRIDVLDLALLLAWACPYRLASSSPMTVTD